MDSDTKQNYEKSKYLVKKWERDFKKTTKQIPTKDDIRCAPLKIRDAYKTYWKLKTLVLENTLSDVLDENASDCFNAKENQVHDLRPANLEDSVYFEPVLETTVSDLNSSSILSPFEIEADSSQGLNFKNCLNNSKVWGEHLNNKIDDGLKTRKLEKKSISFQYAEKIFNNSTKFTKRNPRKSLSLRKCKTVLSTEPSPLEDKTQESFSEPFISSLDEVSENDFHFNLIDEKTKIVIKSSNSTSQAVNLLQKTFGNEEKKDKLFKVDKEWLDRITEHSKIPELKKIETSQDSGIDSQKDESIENRVIESDDELICNSDTESQNVSVLNLLSKTQAAKPIKRSLEDKQVSVAKKPRIEYEAIESTTKPEILKPIKTVRKEVVVRDAKKMAELEKQVKSGKANENFVSINIQKKVYARGKKKMTYSKYKKQKWNDLKAERSKGSNGVLKCFKCKDVGHFSKACPKAGKELMPLDEYESEDECPFPTLEEAADMCKEAAEKNDKIKEKTNVKVDTVDIEAPDEDEKSSIENLGSTINPLYKLNSDGTLIDTPPEVYKALKEFGYTSFRPGQEKAIMRILSGQSTLVTLSTGSGKSLCYQLPAYLYNKHYERCVTLVVSPLISLMDDQVQGKKCFQAASLHTNQTEKKRTEILDELKSGKLSALLVSPETLVSLDSSYAKSLLASLPPIAFACIDEAHCLYQWCHNFRPSYLTVTQVLKEKLGIKTFLGLTATASCITLDSITKSLSINTEDSNSIISDTPLPDNLILSASLTDNETKKQSDLLELLSGKRFQDCDSIIIYCTRRDQCEKVAAFSQDGKNALGRISIHAEAYHAGLTAGRRNQVQNKFMTGKLRIVVATVAFGMGIDKSNLRGIIHYNMPSNFERYVQEVGRAGRDGQPAHCHLFLDSKNEDLNELRRHIYCDSIDRHTIRKLLQSVFVPCKCTEECPKHEIAFPIEETVEALDLPQVNISTLLAYLELDKGKWIKSLPLAYTKCKVTSYKGAKHLKSVAKKNAPLAVAMAKVQDHKDEQFIDFDVIELARNIKWDSGQLKRILKNLEWTKVNEKPAKSGLLVELYNLGFRVLAPGNLSDIQLDEALNVLHSTVIKQEQNNLASLQVFYSSLAKVAYKNVAECADSIDLERSEILKNEIRNYFLHPETVVTNTSEVKLENEEEVANDIRRFIAIHKTDSSMTGRTIARILHGIGSPNYPPIVWGRTKFWRLHLDKDFNLLCKLATKQLILMR